MRASATQTFTAVYDYGQAGEFFYLLMEFVDGVNLRQAMQASRFTPAQALAIVPKICDALQYAHEEGVLHRDIKPENILLDAKGRVKLADFGIAKIIAQADPATAVSHPGDELAMTRAGTTLGTPQYMAPEQRETPDNIDHRADIYSLGVVFYELLTGELPLGGFAPPSALSAAEPRVDAIVGQALEKMRDRRQGSARELRTQVEAATASQPSAGAAEGIPLRSGRGIQRSSGRWGRQLVRMIAALLLFCFAVPFLLHRLLPPAYYARAVVQPDRPLSEKSPTAGEEQLKVLQSDAVLERAIRSLERRWGGKLPLPKDRMLNVVRDSLELRVFRGTSIEISVCWDDRDEVAPVANAVAIAYRDLRWDALKQDLERRLQPLRQELEKQEKRAERTVAEVAEIRIRDGIDDPDPADLVGPIAARESSTDLQPYIDARARDLQARRILGAIRAALLEEGLNAEPAKIWELADAPQDPVLFSFHRFRYAFSR